jgi:hypothetical protein
MPLKITKSPSMIGDTVRPPCVVNNPKSSLSDRSQITLPSRDRASNNPPTPSA